MARTPVQKRELKTRWWVILLGGLICFMVYLWRGFTVHGNIGFVPGMVLVTVALAILSVAQLTFKSLVLYAEEAIHQQREARRKDAESAALRAKQQVS